MKNKTINEFLDHIMTAQTPLVGGGSTAALCGAVAASLFGLVSSISASKLSEDQKKTLEQMLNLCKNVKEKLLDDISRDCHSFDGVMSAYKLPKETVEEKEKRNTLIQEGYKLAIEIPLGVASSTITLFECIEFLMKYGNKNAETDILTAAMCARVAVDAAVYNARINLRQVKEKEYVDNLSIKIRNLQIDAHNYENRILQMSDLVI